MPVIEAQCASILVPHDHRHINQMSMPIPVCSNMATTTPLGPPSAQTSQKQHAGLLELDAHPSGPSVRLP
jgi:hypothetical protein